MGGNNLGGNAGGNNLGGNAGGNNLGGNAGGNNLGGNNLGGNNLGGNNLGGNAGGNNLGGNNLGGNAGGNNLGGNELGGNNLGGNNLGGNAAVNGGNNLGGNAAVNGGNNLGGNAAVNGGLNNRQVVNPINGGTEQTNGLFDPRETEVTIMNAVQGGNVPLVQEANPVLKNAIQLDNQGGAQVMQAMNNMDRMMTNEVPVDGLNQGNIATNLMANMGNDNRSSSR